MKGIKKTICLVLVMLMVLMGTTAFAGTKYSNSVGLGNVLTRATEAPETTEEPLPSEAPAEETAPEATEEPAAEEMPEQDEAVTVIFQRDAEGNLVLDENGDPVVTIPEGAEAPVGFVRDENGALVLDESGNPIPTYEVTEESAEETAPEETEEPAEETAPEETEEPAVEETAPEATEEPAAEETAPEATEEPAAEETAPEAAEEPAAEETAPEATEEPAADEMPIVEDIPQYLTDAEGNVILDENGNPYSAAEYTLDENGNIVAIVVEEEAAAEEESAEEETVALRQITVVLSESETCLALYAEADEASAVLAEIPAGALLSVKEITADWSYAVYGELEGYVLTSKIALYNEEAAPEEEEIVRSIKVTSSAADMVVFKGTEITMSAKLTGFDDVNYSVQWQYTPDYGATACDIEGANGEEYTFTINDDNAHYLYRICVTIHEDVAAEEAMAE